MKRRSPRELENFEVLIHSIKRTAAVTRRKRIVTIELKLLREEFSFFILYYAKLYVSSNINGIHVFAD